MPRAMLGLPIDSSACARAAVAVAAALCVAGCKVGTPGELGHDDFRYTCDAPSDPACDDQGWEWLEGKDRLETIPGSVAVGSTFQLAVGYDSEASIVPVAPDMISAVGQVFTVEQSGRVALLGRGGDGLVTDLIHVDAEVPNGVQLDPPSLALAVGEAQWVRAVPVHGSVSLYGALPCAWTSAAESVASVISDASDNVVQVYGAAPGSTMLHLTIGERSYDVPVTVGGQP